jgi:hypothetical protein
LISISVRVIIAKIQQKNLRNPGLISTATLSKHILATLADTTEHFAVLFPKSKPKHRAEK